MADVSGNFIEKAIHNERMSRIKCMFNEGCTREFLLKVGYTEEEVAEAQSLMATTRKMNPMQELLQRSRMECLSKNPMTMEEIDKVIHEENG